MNNPAETNITGHAPAAKKPASILLLLSIALALLTIMWFRAQFHFRAGHMDEYDYLFVAKTLLAELNWPTHTYIFGSDLSWYLFGWGEEFFGGLAGARSVAALLGIVSLFGAYLFTKEIWQSKRIALVATFLLAASAGHIFISRLASYDVVSFAFFSLAMMPLLRSCRVPEPTVAGSTRYLYLIGGMLLLSGAILTKYTTAAYLPFIGLFMIIVAPVPALVGGTILSLSIASYLFIHWSDLVVLYQVQISGTHGANTTYQDILTRTAYYVSIPLGLTLLSIYKARQLAGQRRNTLVKLYLLLAFSTPLFLYHLQGRNLISLYKHLNFSQLFLVAAAAWLIDHLYDHFHSNLHSIANKVRVKPVLFAAFTILFTLFNMHQLKGMESGYPDIQRLLNHLGQHNTVRSTNILSEDPYLFRYLAFDDLPQERISETSWLDNNKDGKHTHQDVLDALWDKKFQIVLLTDAIHPVKNTEYRKILNQRGYVQQYEESYELTTVMTSNNTGTLTLYQLPDRTATVDQ